MLWRIDSAANLPFSNHLITFNERIDCQPCCHDYTFKGGGEIWPTTKSVDNVEKSAKRWSSNNDKDNNKVAYFSGHWGCRLCFKWAKPSGGRREKSWSPWEAKQHTLSPDWLSSGMKQVLCVCVCGGWIDCTLSRETKCYHIHIQRAFAASRVAFCGLPVLGFKLRGEVLSHEVVVVGFVFSSLKLPFQVSCDQVPTRRGRDRLVQQKCGNLKRKENIYLKKKKNKSFVEETATADCLVPVVFTLAFDLFIRFFSLVPVFVVIVAFPWLFSPFGRVSTWSV